MAGAGAGVAFGEYSSLRYEELPISGFDQAITASETVEVGGRGDVFVSTVYGGGCSSEIVADESVAPNTLVINARCSAWLTASSFRSRACLFTRGGVPRGFAREAQPLGRSA